MCSCGSERADLVLALEALERDLVLRDVLVEHLHRDARVGLLVDALVDAAHAAVGDDAADLVAPAEARADARVVGRGRDGRHARGGEARSRRRGRTPRRSGTTRWHVGQLFMPATARALHPALSRAAGARRRRAVQPRPVAADALRSAAPRRPGRSEVDDPVARRALLEHRLAAEAVKELRRQRHVAGLAGAVASSARWPCPRFGADHLVAAVELRRQRLRWPRRARPAWLRALRSTSPSFELMSPSRAPSSSTSFLCSASVASICWRDGVGVGGELADLVLAVAHELAQLFELALRGVRLALGARARRASRASARAAGSCCARPGSSSPRVLSMAASGGAVGGELVVELGDAGLQAVERRALLRELRRRVLSVLRRSARAFRGRESGRGCSMRDSGTGKKRVSRYIAHAGRLGEGAAPTEARRQAGRWASGPTWVRTRNSPVMSRGL